MKIGDTGKCELCGLEYTAASKHQKYCKDPECSLIRGRILLREWRKKTRVENDRRRKISKRTERLIDERREKLKKTMEREKLQSLWGDVPAESLPAKVLQTLGMSAFQRKKSRGRVAASKS